MTPAPLAPGARIRRWRRYTLEAAAVLIVFVALQTWNSSSAVRGTAPPLRGQSTDGSVQTLTLSAREPTMVHFWATWCGICEAMDGNVASMADDHRVVTVALASGGPGAVRQHLDDSGLDFGAIVDDDGQHAGRWGVRGVPTTFFLTADGEVDSVTVGYSTWLGLRWRLWWAGRS